MGKQAINLTSVTYAMKAQKILERRGIFSHIGKSRRNQAGMGCGYSLYVHDKDVLMAIGILTENGLTIVSVDKVGV